LLVHLFCSVLLLSANPVNLEDHAIQIPLVNGLQVFVGSEFGYVSFVSQIVGAYTHVLLIKVLILEDITLFDSGFEL
jgi:hypothetical protein